MVFCCTGALLAAEAHRESHRVPLSRRGNVYAAKQRLDSPSSLGLCHLGSGQLKSPRTGSLEGSGQPKWPWTGSLEGSGQLKWLWTVSLEGPGQLKWPWAGPLEGSGQLKWPWAGSLEGLGKFRVCWSPGVFVKISYRYIINSR